MAFPTRTPAPVTSATRARDPVRILRAAPAPGIPERLLAARAPVREARRDEEEVREPVQVGEQRRVDLDLGGEQHGAPLRPPADGARDVERRRGPGAAGQDEAR